MEAVTQGAATELFLLNLGARSTAKIVAWADAAIARDESTHPLLIELSTTSLDRIDNFISILSDLARGSNFWSAVRDGMPALREFLLAHPEDARRVSSALLMHFMRERHSMPAEFFFIYEVDDAFDLAHAYDGAHGTVESAYQDFLKALRGLEAAPNQFSLPKPSAAD